MDSIFRFGFTVPLAGVAQLAEQLICNQQVAGSSPITGFFSCQKAFSCCACCWAWRYSITLRLPRRASTIDPKEYGETKEPCEDEEPYEEEAEETFDADEDETDTEYVDYTAMSTRIRQRNDELLEIFVDDLEASGFSDKTIDRHLTNADFYLNTFLLRENLCTMEDGLYMLGSFLGNFFIRKCLWSTPATIKTTAASIKKFYKSMLDHGFIEKEDYAALCEEIRESMGEWQALCETFNDASQENPFGFPY